MYSTHIHTHIYIYIYVYYFPCISYDYMISDTGVDNPIVDATIRVSDYYLAISTMGDHPISVSI